MKKQYAFSKLQELKNPSDRPAPSSVSDLRAKQRCKGVS
jgi:hypothetical protein